MPKGCAWIHGEPDGAGTRYCGQPTVDGTWCARHRRRIYLGVEPPEDPPPAEEEDPADADL